MLWFVDFCTASLLSFLIHLISGWGVILATLYVVATPIGNLKDITLRALETLATVSLIAAEDTRVAQKLLTSHGVSASLISYHQHNADTRDSHLLNLLQEGQDIALLTDAGTPLISDPGSSLVARCRSEKIDVVPIPGASAMITALSVSDLAVNRFCFEGFLPPKKAARCKRLQELVAEHRAIVFYEAKHRIIDLLADIVEVFGSNRRVMLARELTKMYEQLVTHQADIILSMLKDGSIAKKGEFVVIVEGQSLELDQAENLSKAHILFDALKNSVSHKDAVKLAQSLYPLPKNQLYDIAQQYFK